jgi:hypothetical protein
MYQVEVDEEAQDADDASRFFMRTTLVGCRPGGKSKKRLRGIEAMGT